jgi:glycine/D-amino acid oxidase-like deaminating enzyme
VFGRVEDQRPADDASVWVAESETPVPAQSLTSRVRADVAVVGGGLTGVSAAWHLAQRRPGLGVALLEAGVLGAGASGRNGGQVLHWINGVEPGSHEEARRIYAATGLGIDLAEELAGRFAPPDTFRRQGALEVYTDPQRAEAAARRAAWLREAGIPTEFVPESALGVAGARGAILDPRAGRLNGFALLQAMRPALRDAGVAVHEHSPVRRVRRRGGIVLETPQGEVRASALVLAAGTGIPALGFFRRGLLPIESHVLATAPLGAELWARIGWGAWDGFTDDLDRIAYACRTPGGRLLFGGGGNPAYSYRLGGAPGPPPRLDDAPGRFMRRSMARYFPGLADVPVERRWSGTLDITFDRVCSIGVGGPDRNVYHALGFSGHGIALALMAGRALADLYEGHHDPWRALPFYQKRLLSLPPEPLRWLAYQAYTRVTGRSPRRRR